MKSFDDIRPIAAGALICGAGLGVISNSSGLFVRPVCETLGFSRGGFAAVSSISLIFSMITAVYFGRRLKKGRIRPLLLCCAAVCCSVPVGYSFCGKIWQFYLLAAVNGLAVNGITMLTASVAASSSSCGRAVSTGAAAAGASIFSALTLPVISDTIERSGWRCGYRIQAGMAFAVLLLAALMLKEKAPQAAEKNDSAIKLGWQYAPICAALFCANFVNMSHFVNMAPFLGDIGFSAAKAAGAVSLCTLAAVVTKPLFGVIADKFGMKTGAAVLSLSLLASCVTALILPKNSSPAVIYPVLVSMCSAANGVFSAAAAAWLFDSEDFAPASARLTQMTTAATVLANPVGGLVFDISGGYNMLWFLCILLSVISFVPFFSRRR